MASLDLNELNERLHVIKDERMWSHQNMITYTSQICTWNWYLHVMGLLNCLSNKKYKIRSASNQRLKIIVSSFPVCQIFITQCAFSRCTVCCCSCYSTKPTHEVFTNVTRREFEALNGTSHLHVDSFWYRSFPFHLKWAWLILHGRD